MKHLKNLAVACVIAAAPMGANALTYNVLNSSSNLSNNTANNFAPQYGAFLPGTASWGVGAAPITVTPPPGSVGGAYLSPWANTANPALNNVNSYFVVQPNAVTAGSPPSTFPGSPDPAKLSLGSLQNMFTFLWGSIDVENRVEFFSGSTSLGSVTGSQVVGATSQGGAAKEAGCGPLISNSYGCVAEVRFMSDVGFDRIEFNAGSAPNDNVAARNSFEFATIPLPAAAWLLLGVSGALVAAKRRSARKAA